MIDPKLDDMEYLLEHFECERCGTDFPIDTVVEIKRLNYFPLYICRTCAGLDGQ
jgi:hypothetical protein